MPQINEKAITSSLTLQLVLSVNCVLYLFLLPVLIYGAASTTRSWYLHVLSVALILLEPSRLWFGYSGNLGERIPHILLFLALSIFPSGSLGVTMLSANPDLTGGEWAVLVLMVIFCGFGFFSGFVGLVRLMKKQMVESRFV